MTETRTVLLAEDGRYVTLGRHSEPSQDEIDTAIAALIASGSAGWVASMIGSPWLGLLPDFVMRQPAGRPRAGFDSAAHKARLAIAHARNAAHETLRA